MYSIRFIAQEEKEIIIPLLMKLDPSIPKNTLLERVNAMFQQGYKCIGVFDNHKLIGMSGLWVLVKYYVGKHVEPDNVYILSEYQGKGVGKQLMQWIYDYAKSIGCSATELNCYVKNKPAQKFWENQGFELLGYHYQKKI